jgi:integrase/recombinase XerD
MSRSPTEVPFLTWGTQGHDALHSLGASGALILSERFLSTPLDEGCTRIQTPNPPDQRLRMIDTLFSSRPILSRQFAAPLLAEREEFLNHLLQQNKCRSYIKSTASMLVNVIEYLDLNQRRTVSLMEIKEASSRWVLAKPWRVPRRVVRETSKRFIMNGACWLRFLQLLEEPERKPIPFEDLLIAYISYIMKVRRLLPTSVKSYREHTTAFLRWLGSRYSSFAEVTPDAVEEYVAVLREHGLTVASLATLTQRLRGFFRFAESRGVTPYRISNTIESPIIHRYDTTSKGPAWADVRKMLQAERNETKRAIQARVIVAMCGIYGMRGAEVEQLTLDDFDWREELVVIKRVKGGRTQRFPLSYEVGNIILLYLKQSRPPSRSRHLFISLNHPHTMLKLPALRRIVRNRMLELDICSPNYGLHSLRHSCATQLLHRGASLDEISEYLGHRGKNWVSTYAKPSPQSIRKVASFDLGEIL